MALPVNRLDFIHNVLRNLNKVENGDDDDEKALLFSWSSLLKFSAQLHADGWTGVQQDHIGTRIARKNVVTTKNNIARRFKWQPKLPSKTNIKTFVIANCYLLENCLKIVSQLIIIAIFASVYGRNKQSEFQYDGFLGDR